MTLNLSSLERGLWVILSQYKQSLGLRSPVWFWGWLHLQGGKPRATLPTPCGPQGPGKGGDLVRACCCVWEVGERPVPCFLFLFLLALLYLLTSSLPFSPVLPSCGQ